MLIKKSSVFLTYSFSFEHLLGIYPWKAYYILVSVFSYTEQVFVEIFQNHYSLY